MLNFFTVKCVSVIWEVLKLQAMELSIYQEQVQLWKDSISCPYISIQVCVRTRGYYNCYRLIFQKLFTYCFRSLFFIISKFGFESIPWCKSYCIFLCPGTLFAPCTNYFCDKTMLCLKKTLKIVSPEAKYELVWVHYFNFCLCNSR